MLFRPNCFLFFFCFTRIHIYYNKTLAVIRMMYNCLFLYCATEGQLVLCVCVHETEAQLVLCVCVCVCVCVHETEGQLVVCVCMKQRDSFYSVCVHETDGQLILCMCVCMRQRDSK